MVPFSIFFADRLKISILKLSNYFCLDASKLCNFLFLHYNPITFVSCKTSEDCVSDTSIKYQSNFYLVAFPQTCDCCRNL